MITTWKRVLVLAPHTDDGEFGCGGTMARLVEAGCEVRYVAFSIATRSLPDGFEPGTLAREVREATAELGIPESCLTVHDFDVRTFPERRQDILDELIRLRDSLSPDVVVIPSSSDIHQDHAVVSQEAVRAFRRASSIFGYDFPWNVLQTSPLQFYVELTDPDLARKVKALQCYKSQLVKPNNCLSAEYVRSLAIERGNRIGRHYAEAFEVMREVRLDGRGVF